MARRGRPWCPAPEPVGSRGPWPLQTLAVSLQVSGPRSAPGPSGCGKRGQAPPHKKKGKPEQPKSWGASRKDCEAQGGKPLPDVTEEDVLLWLKDFNPQHVKRGQPGFKSNVPVGFSCPEQAQCMVQPLGNCTRILGNTDMGNSMRGMAWPRSQLEMPALEKIPEGELGLSSGIGPQHLLQPQQQTAPHAVKHEQVRYAVPMEMRGSFLVLMLRDCYKDLSWLAVIAKTYGDVGLLVTDCLPQTPYFWAIHLTEERHLHMQQLLGALAQAEKQQPYLAKQKVKRGTRCLAQCVLGADSRAWNRCWVLDKVEDLAVVFFVDFGCSATIPVSSLRQLDDDDFWAIWPLAQPFMFQKAILPPRCIVQQVLRGEVVGPSPTEPHILQFAVCIGD
ncbi:tudor domain-containing protein 10 isoform X2 [Alligator mississippiensis]|uniref:Tudor domain-containing protein 10 isoform A n=1 Tax=Alligator mississippiensis TaxID=8496 RepID=A0A151NSS7_ALLMI|nr:tudor domain-containing protein 10 isoform X2 [Alligator mississippiensis]KYO39917.1 tudor domain-containing protein 10 isoform A [Alligator mississippiensis]